MEPIDLKLADSVTGMIDAAYNMHTTAKVLQEWLRRRQIMDGANPVRNIDIGISSTSVNFQNLGPEHKHDIQMVEDALRNIADRQIARLYGDVQRYKDEI